MKSSTKKTSRIVSLFILVVLVFAVTGILKSSGGIGTEGALYLRDNNRLYHISIGEQ